MLIKGYFTIWAKISGMGNRGLFQHTEVNLPLLSQDYYYATYFLPVTFSSTFSIFSSTEVADCELEGRFILSISASP